ncbi:hypothetical protein J6590_107031 [Homalodisca vitripennis]|nr:hypothetical protein J6590_107031 [Homalodisca vitripennis]
MECEEIDRENHVASKLVGASDDEVVVEGGEKEVFCWSATKTTSTIAVATHRLVAGERGKSAGKQLNHTAVKRAGRRAWSGRLARFKGFRTTVTTDAINISISRAHSRELPYKSQEVELINKLQN